MAGDRAAGHRGMGTAHGQLKTGRRGPCRGRDAGRFEQRAAADHVVLGMLDAEHAQALESINLASWALYALSSSLALIKRFT
jgi:hypothetical protein